MKRVALTVIGIAWALMSFAQGGSTQGKEFWLSYMQNGYYENYNSGGITEGVIPQLTVSAKRTCQVTVTNPYYPNWSLSFTVPGNSIVERNLPKEYCYHMGNDNEAVKNKGIHVIATDTVSVYCANIANYSFDASFVLPIESLGSDYIIQCGEQSTISNVSEEYKRLNQTSAFLIVAAEDNTVVNITPTVNTLGGHVAGVTFSITLDAGQTYHVRSNNTANSSGRDLSGTRVTADDCKKIAVFNGNTLTRIPTTYYSGNTGLDHIFEQAMPLPSWGKHFIITESMNRNRDFIRVTSASDGNVIKRNGTTIATLAAGASHIFSISRQERSCYLEASSPCAVYLYNTCADDGKADGDPSMAWIAPMEQKINDVTFATFTHNQASINSHYVNIVVRTDDTDKVYLDGAIIPSSAFETVNGNSDYSFTRQANITHGEHHLSCVNGFNAHVYGFGNAKGYAYLTGSKAVDISTTLTIDDIVIGDGEHLDYCTDATINFDVEVNYENAQVTWNFGDGSPLSHDFHTEHSYTEEDEYQITLTVEAEAACMESSTLTTSFTISIHKAIHETLDPVTICWDENGQVPQIYNENGFFIEYYGPGSYPATIFGQTQYGCEHTKTMTLFVMVPGGITDIDTVLCRAVNPVFELTLSNGQTISYTDSGHYELEDGSGPCPQTFLIDLEFYDKPEPDTTTIPPQCSPYFWEINGETYDQSGLYYVESDDLEGCGQDYYLNLTINSAELLPDIYLLDSCNTAYFQSEYWADTTFEANTQYTFTGLTEDGCERQQTVIVEGMDYTPLPEIRCMNQGVDPHYVITATEFNVNRYTYRAVDPRSEDSWLPEQCEWTLSKESWLLVPSEDNHSCSVYPMEWVEDTIWLTFKAVNRCSGDEGVIVEFYLIPSFYGINENVNQTFSIIPNPNQGNMDLCFHGMEGIVNVQIYDMKGLLVDRFDLYNDEESRHNYTLKTPSKGLFLFVFKQDDIQFIRKVLITD